MGIKNQIDYVFKHPFFTLAMNNYQNGNDADLRHLFFEIIYHTYEKSTLNAAKSYSVNRWLDTCEILAEVRHTAPPENLDVRLPIPSKKVMSMIKKPQVILIEKPKTPKIRKIVQITNQLNLFIQIA